MAVPEDRLVRVHCENNHTWTAAELPMTVMPFTELLKRARCPYCKSKKTFIGPAPAPPKEDHGSI